MTRGEAAGQTVHATAFALGEHGVLIQGAAGAGKTALAFACIGAGSAQGSFARLIGDDRIALLPRHGRLIASAHEAILGKVERRGLHIEALEPLPRAVLRLAVELVSDPREAASLPRLPWLEPSQTQICGVSIALLRLDPRRDRADQAALVLAALKHAAP